MRYSGALNALRCSSVAAAALLLAATTPAMAKDVQAETIDSDPAEFAITRFSVGPIALGSTIADAQLAAPDLSFVRGVGSENIIVVEVLKDDVLLMVLYTDEEIEFDEEGNPPPVDVAALITGVDIVDPRYRTQDGIHVGMAAEDAERVMGPLKTMHYFPHEGEVPTFERQPGHLRFTASIGEGFEATTAGVYEDVPDCDDTYPPLCQIARSFNPGAEIASMAIGLGGDTPQEVMEITGLPEGFRIIREGPSGDQCSSELPITTFNVWSPSLPSRGFQPIEIAGGVACVEEYQPFQRLAYDEQAFVYFGDYNFDGSVDFALHNGLRGGYGSMTYNVYFFDPASGLYVVDEDFSNLTDSLGMFEVDPAQKMITVYSKSGAWWHQRQGYNVVDGKPVLVFEETEEYTSDTQKTVTTRQLVDGAWTTTSEVETVEPEAE